MKSESQPVPVFDGHNDAILRLWMGGGQTASDQFRSSATGHIDLKKAHTGGYSGAFFALFAPPHGAFKMPAFQPPYDEPLPPELPYDQALQVIIEQAGILARLDRDGLLKLCRTGAELRSAMANGQLGAIMHMEGAEAIGPDLTSLDLLYEAGLRSIGPVWSRPTIFGHGVPFRYPSDGDIGAGLTDAGKGLVSRCATLGIIVDTSHLNMAGFWDVGDAGLPLVATHSNAHSISPGARNLTDAQLRAIGDSGGVVGLNFGTMFLDPGGRADPSVGFDLFIKHLSHMIDLAGEDAVAFGSDFDGAPMPQCLPDCGRMQSLVTALDGAGFGADLIKKICAENWMAFLDRTLHT